MNCILYYYMFCGYSRTIRFLMEENSVDFDISHQTPWNMSKECSAFCKIHNYPTIFDGHRSIECRSAIIEYLNIKYCKNTLFPKDLQARLDVLQSCDWVEDNISLLCKQIVEERLHAVFVHKKSVDTIKINRVLDILHINISKMTHMIDKNNGYIVNGSISMADILAASFLSTIDYFGYIQWSSLYDLKTWYLKIKSRRNFYKLYDDVLKNLQPSRFYNLLDF